MSREYTYSPDEGEFVDFATLDDWEAQGRAKDALIAQLTAERDRLRGLYLRSQEQI